MTQSTMQTRQSERGFTLVELAIVMIIIGLLIGGILKGQELINNARVSSAVTQIKGVEGAINTFRDKYSAVPGDILNAGNRLPNCAGECAQAGNGNSLIEVTTTAGNVGAATADDEGGHAFVHLMASGVLSGPGVDTSIASGSWAAATAYPDFNIGGKITIGYNTTDPTGTPGTDVLTGHYMGVGSIGGAAMGAETIAASQAAAIDRKLDDGLPNAGSVRATGGGATATAADCANGTTNAAVYNEGSDGKVCGLLVRTMN